MHLKQVLKSQKEATKGFGLAQASSNFDRELKMQNAEL